MSTPTLQNRTTSLYWALNGDSWVSSGTLWKIPCQGPRPVTIPHDRIERRSLNRSPVSSSLCTAFMMQEIGAGGLMPSPAEKGADVSGNVARPRPTSTSSNLRPLLPRWSPSAYSEHLAASRVLLGGTVAWHAHSSSTSSGRGQEIHVFRGSVMHV